MTAVSRRMFLRASAVAGGGVLFSFGWDLPAAGAQGSSPLQPNGFVRLDGDGTIEAIESDLVRDGRIEPGSRVLYAHLGGQPALNAYAGAF